ncbi:hypothetical protein IAD21_02269 [Abditibacteriota bacterium]|nr:hypothetical protein IAD21_02269 [Abditibacteriota bacterium]
MNTTSPTTTEKSARLSCRIRPVVKEQAEAAARLLGQSMTDFAEMALEEKAKTVLAENERIVLSEHAFGEFLAAISGAPESPSQQLLEAVAVYKQHETVVPAKSISEQGHK